MGARREEEAIARAKCGASAYMFRTNELRDSRPSNYTARRRRDRIGALLAILGAPGPRSLGTVEPKRRRFVDCQRRTKPPAAKQRSLFTRREEVRTYIPRHGRRGSFIYRPLHSIPSTSTPREAEVVGWHPQGEAKLREREVAASQRLSDVDDGADATRRGRDVTTAPRRNRDDSGHGPEA